MEAEKSLRIDKIVNGIVIDHIKAGNAMKIYHYLNFEALDCTIAIIKNVKSAKHGYKDIIKIENNIDIDLDVLGYIDPNVTINIIKDGSISDKHCLKLPKQIKNVVKCKNPRCISSIEQDLEQMFELMDEKSEVYRCVYCRQELVKTTVKMLY